MPALAELRKLAVLLDMLVLTVAGWELGPKLLDGFGRFMALTFEVDLPDEEVRDRRYLGRDDGYGDTEGREESMTYGGDKRTGRVFVGKVSAKDERRDDSERLSG